MRCSCCDVELTPYESTRKSVSDGSYLDMCNECYKYISDVVPSITRKDLANKAEFTNYEADEDYENDD